MRRSPKQKLVEILLVEDSPGDIRLTIEALKESRIPNNMSVVKDGVEALAFLRKEGKYFNSPRPDFILLDLMLPKKDGHEVLKDIRSDTSLKNIPVAILTSSEDEGDIHKAYKYLVNGYIVKKADIKELARCIEHFWGFSGLTKTDMPLRAAPKIKKKVVVKKRRLIKPL
ncbi:MAG: response regulator [Spirochaetales bacterium]|nr:response regulator [Spirochaetales bacterium]